MDSINIIPSIDLIDGKIVRLYKGKIDNKYYYDIDPIRYIDSLLCDDLKNVHIVDLDGAFRRDNTKNKKVIKSILDVNYPLRIDIGGGIRYKDQIERYLDLGASQICLGSVTMLDELKTRHFIDYFGAETFIFCPDHKDGFITINGWTTNCDVPVTQYIDFWSKLGIYDYICTDVEKDGTFDGPNIDIYKLILKYFPSFNIIASGGTASVDDIEKLVEIGIPSVIIGKAFLDGKILFNK